MDDGKYLYPDLKKQAIYWGHSINSLVVLLFLVLVTFLMFAYTHSLSGVGFCVAYAIITTIVDGNSLLDTLIYKVKYLVFQRDFTWKNKTYEMEKRDEHKRLLIKKKERKN